MHHHTQAPCICGAEQRRLTSHYYVARAFGPDSCYLEPFMRHTTEEHIDMVTSERPSLGLTTDSWRSLERAAVLLPRHATLGDRKPGRAVI